MRTIKGNYDFIEEHLLIICANKYDVYFDDVYKKVHFSLNSFQKKLIKKYGVLRSNPYEQFHHMISYEENSKLISEDIQKE